MIQFFAISYCLSPTGQQWTIMLRVLQREGQHSQKAEFLPTEGRMAPIRRKLLRKCFASSPTWTAAKIFRKQNLNTKLYTPKEAKLITTNKLRRRANYFTNSFPHYYFYSSDKKKHPWKKIWCVAPCHMVYIKTYIPQTENCNTAVLFLSDNTYSQSRVTRMQRKERCISFLYLKLTSRQNIINPKHAKALPDQI